MLVKLFVGLALFEQVIILSCLFVVGLFCILNEKFVSIFLDDKMDFNSSLKINKPPGTNLTLLF